MRADDGAFVSYAELLRVPAVPAPPDEPAATVAEPARPAPEYEDVLRDIRLFRARLADALEAACAALEPDDAAEARLALRLAAVLDAVR